MKLILDEAMPVRTAGCLREAGLDAQHIIELGMGGAPDEAVLAKAREFDAALATFDSDFHRLLATAGATGPSVIRIRIEGLKGPQLADLLMDVVERTREELLAGAVLSVNEKRIRLRRLPIGG
jgi:predicted nuclease of predicted toxin-antitoxin system